MGQPDTEIVNAGESSTQPPAYAQAALSPSEPPDAETRQRWLANLEISDKVKGRLLSALATGDVAGAMQLLEDGEASKKDIRTKAIKLPTGLTAMHLAALYGDEEVLAKLQSMHGDPNVTVYCQNSSYSVMDPFWMDARPLVFAVGAKNLSIIQKLLESGASCDMNDAWALFSIEWWVLTNRFDWAKAKEILKYLLQYKLDINSRVAKLKWTMLHYVINIEPRQWASGAEEFLRERYDTVGYLLQNGADALVKDTFGRTAFKLVEERSPTISSAGLTPQQLAEMQKLRADADERLKVLLQKAMIDQVEAIKAKGGFKGSLQRLVLSSQALDRIPLLGSRGSFSLRRSSVASTDNRSQMSDATLRA